MTSFTRKLYNRDPAAATAYYRQSTFEQKLVYGKVPTLACFTPAWHQQPVSFGKRQPPASAQHACDHNCKHPACKQGCVLWAVQH
jgi:hypothetical protein